jgi:tripeptide aminopeptidase
MKTKVQKKFLRYVKINTQSKEDADVFPSTKNQFDFANLLVDELKALDLGDAGVDNYCYVMASLPANIDKEAPKIGLIAHMDTSPEVSGENVKPQTIETYEGGDIVINKDKNFVIKASENPDLKNCIGDTLITSDGTTLLSADDKAGIAAIMTTLEIEGRNIHPGTAKDIMVNAISVMGNIISRLPKDMTPETTEGFDPFLHPMTLQGSVAKASMKMILRDFKTEGLDAQKEIIEKIISQVQALYPKAIINLEITETYRNMRDELEKHTPVTDRVWAAAEKAGLTPEWEPIRGGTDGSRLTAMGLPTPNIFTGGSNFHSTTEWLSVDGLVNSVETLLNIVKVEDA